MSETIDEIMEYIEREDAKFIRLAFCDAFGIQKNISVMPSEIKKAIEDGTPINPRDIAGFEGCKGSNLYLKPDPSTLAILPWRPDSGRVVRMFCDVCTADGKPYAGDTRTILKSAVKKAKSSGVQFHFSSEAEFYLFKKDDDGGITNIPYDEAGYMDIAPKDKGENIRREICLTIEKMGLIPERSHHERGPGQNEIDFHYGKPVKAADQMTTFKMVVSTVADRNGLFADFSPVPLPYKPGNGYHINVFAETMSGEDMSKYAAAGILDKISDMTLFLNPSEGSYTRFGNCSAPDRINWSGEEDSGLIYMSEIRGIPMAELRSPDALSNPYLAYALLIHAGLYGIENKLSLPKEMDPNGIFLPKTRKEACEIAKNSSFIKDVLPKEIIESYIA